MSNQAVIMRKPETEKGKSQDVALNQVPGQGCPTVPPLLVCLERFLKKSPTEYIEEMINSFFRAAAKTADSGFSVRQIVRDEVDQAISYVRIQGGHQRQGHIFRMIITHRPDAAHLDKHRDKNKQLPGVRPFPGDTTHLNRGQIAALAFEEIGMMDAMGDDLVKGLLGNGFDLIRLRDSDDGRFKDLVLVHPKREVCVVIQQPIARQVVLNNSSTASN